MPSTRPINKLKASSLINKLIVNAERIHHDEGTLGGWSLQCQSVLDNIFGPNSSHLQRLQAVSFEPSFVGFNDTTSAPRAFNDGMQASIEILRAVTWHIRTFGLGEAESTASRTEQGRLPGILIAAAATTQASNQFLQAMMPRQLPQSRTARIFIAGPGDAEQERSQAIEIIHQWNAAHANERGLVLLPVTAASNVRAGFGGHPQDIINMQTLRTCQLLVAIFRSRLGMRTAKAASGTVQEITEFIESDYGQFAMLFFSKQPHPPNVDTDNLNELRNFKESVQDKCLYVEFDNDFATLFRQQLELAMAQLAKAFNVSPPEPPPELTSAQLFTHELRIVANYVRTKLLTYRETSDIGLAQKMLGHAIAKLRLIYNSHRRVPEGMALTELTEIIQHFDNLQSPPVISKADFWWKAADRAVLQLQELADHTEVF